MSRFVVSVQAQWIGDTIRALPSPKQFVEFGSQAWTMHRQHRAFTAAMARDWGVRAAGELEEWGRPNGVSALSHPLPRQAFRSPCFGLGSAAGWSDTFGSADDGVSVENLGFRFRSRGSRMLSPG